MSSTRRSALRFSAAALVAGIASPALARVAVPGADAELIAIHAVFMASHARIKWDGDSGLTEDELGREMDRWYAALERATELSPVTAEGRRAKVEIAHAAMTTCVEDHQREEMCALSVLADLLGSAAA